MATFVIPYENYMAAIQRGMVFHGARLRPGRMFSYSKVIKAKNRDRAVYNALQWYWGEINGEWGQACSIMKLSDPYSEVCFWDDFDCSLRSNNYLDDETKERVIAASNGILVENDMSNGTRNHPKNCLKRTKRRRVYLQRVGHNIYEHPTTGVMYYRQTTTPQVSSNGKQGKPGNISQKRKVTNVRLEATGSVSKAAREIFRRFGEIIDV